MVEALARLGPRTLLRPFAEQDFLRVGLLVQRRETSASVLAEFTGNRVGLARVIVTATG